MALARASEIINFGRSAYSKDHEKVLKELKEADDEIQETDLNDTNEPDDEAIRNGANERMAEMHAKINGLEDSHRTLLQLIKSVNDNVKAIKASVPERHGDDKADRDKQAFELELARGRIL